MLVPLALVVIVGASHASPPPAPLLLGANGPERRLSYPTQLGRRPHGVCPRRSHASSMFGLLSARPRADSAVFYLQAPPPPK
jgi:hypothetical protein